MLDHYLHSAYGAAMLIEPHMDPLGLASADPGVVLAEPATGEDTMSWFMAEDAGMLAVVRLAADAGFASHAWQLAWIVSSYLLRRGSWSDNTLAQETGLAAARRAGDGSQ